MEQLYPHEINNTLGSFNAIKLAVWRLHQMNLIIHFNLRFIIKQDYLMRTYDNPFLTLYRKS